MFVPESDADITPADALAVVVGIESYEAGPDWDLDGPAADTVRFVSWLRKRKVPPENIAAFVSPLEKNKPLLWPPDVPQPTAATRDNLDRLLHDTLRARREKMLIFFWGGHGVFHGGKTRRLFYGDARKHHRVNLDLDNMLLLLRGGQWPAHAWQKQIIITDACANLSEREGWTESLAGETYSGGDPLVTREQFVLLAARPGEYAANLNAAQTGLFSRELFAELETRSAGEWPPDMVAITKALVARFESLREQGLARQTPTYFWNRDWESGERSFGAFPAPKLPAALVPASAALLFRDKTALRDALLACPSLRNEHSRDDLRLNLRPAIAHSVNYSRNDRAHAMNLLEACLRHSGGVAELLEVVRGTDAPDPAVDALEQTIRRLLLGALPAP